MLARRSSRLKPTARAFSLVEVLIALAIVAGLALVAWPNIAAMRGRASLESASSSVEAAAAECRASAIRAGQPMRLVVRTPDPTDRGPGFTGLTSLYVEAMDHMKALGAGTTPTRSANDDAPASTGTSRLLAHLDSSVVVSESLEREPGASTSDQLRNPADGTALRDSGVRAADSQPDEPRPEALEITLATFMPDGSAIASHPAFLRARHDADGAMRIDVNRWSGRLDLSPVALHASDPDADTRPLRAPSRVKNDR